MTLSSSQLIDRRSAITATDIPAILGLHPHKSAFDIWLDKTGQSKEIPENDRMKWGNLLEPIIREDYAQRRGYILMHPGTKYLDIDGVTFAATPDAIVSHSHGLEIKTHSHFAADYGREGSDEVPHHIAMQAQIGAELFALPYWDIVSFWDGVPHDFRVSLDLAITHGAIEFCAKWWRRHVVAHVAPVPDGSDAADKAIAKFLPGEWCDAKEKRLIEADEKLQHHIQEFKRARIELATLEKDMHIRKQMLQLEIGEADGLTWIENGKQQSITWRKTKDSKHIDYQAALVDYQNRLAFRHENLAMLVEAIHQGPDLERFTTTKPGHRRFVVPRSWGNNVEENG